jgi:hypothetical protein
VELTLLWVEAEEGMMVFFRRPQLTAALHYAALHYAEKSSAPCNVAQRVGGNGGEGKRRPEAGEAAVTKGSGEH